MRRAGRFPRPEPCVPGLLAFRKMGLSQGWNLARRNCRFRPANSFHLEPPMSDLIGLFNLLAPFFGLIGLGFFCGRVVKQPEAGLAWMQFFLIYVALPCLFYRLIADKPLDRAGQLALHRRHHLLDLLRLHALLRHRLALHPGHGSIGGAGRGRVLFQHRLYGTAAHSRGDRRRRQRPGRPDLRLRQPVPVLARAAADVDGGRSTSSACRRRSAGSSGGS